MRECRMTDLIDYSMLASGVVRSRRPVRPRRSNAWRADRMIPAPFIDHVAVKGNVQEPPGAKKNGDTWLQSRAAIQVGRLTRVTVGTPSSDPAIKPVTDKSSQEDG